jgi:hypothetical protein
MRAALASGVDEVLVVGHSSGAHLAVSVLADLIRAGVPDRRPALGFLSLGQVVPMVVFPAQGGRLRADLPFLSARDELTWVDVTAPGDGCSLCAVRSGGGDRRRARGAALAAGDLGGLHQTLSPRTVEGAARRFFRLHFQYLCAFDRPGGTMTISASRRAR